MSRARTTRRVTSLDQRRYRRVHDLPNTDAREGELDDAVEKLHQAEQRIRELVQENARLRRSNLSVRACLQAAEKALALADGALRHATENVSELLQKDDGPQTKSAAS